MFAMRSSAGGKGRDEAEKPFWISYADLMTALMVLFLVVMSVALLSVTKKVTQREREEAMHQQDIEKLLDRFEAVARQDGFQGITIDRNRRVNARREHTCGYLVSIRLRPTGSVGRAERLRPPLPQTH